MPCYLQFTTTEAGPLCNLLQIYSKLCSSESKPTQLAIKLGFSAEGLAITETGCDNAVMVSAEFSAKNFVHYEAHTEDDKLCFVSVQCHALLQVMQIGKGAKVTVTYTDTDDQFILVELVFPTGNTLRYQLYTVHSENNEHYRIALHDVMFKAYVPAPLVRTFIEFCIDVSDGTLNVTVHQNGVVFHMPDEMQSAGLQRARLRFGKEPERNEETVTKRVLLKHLELCKFFFHLNPPTDAKLYIYAIRDDAFPLVFGMMVGALGQANLAIYSFKETV